MYSPYDLPAPLLMRRGHFKISRRANAQALAAARAQGFGESKAIGLDKSRMQPVRVVEIEGSPYLGVLGFIEWIMLAFFMLGWCVTSCCVLCCLHTRYTTVCPLPRARACPCWPSPPTCRCRYHLTLARLPSLDRVPVPPSHHLLRYVLQYFDGPFQNFCYDYWPYFAAAYSGAFLLHFLLTTRDGYVISLTHTFNLPAIFKASSSRPDPVGCTCRLSNATAHMCLPSTNS